MAERDKKGDTPDYRAERSLDEIQQFELLYSVVRYMGRMAPKADHHTKFDAAFDDNYRRIAAEHRLDLYHADPETGTTWFLASRIAPSLHYRRVGIGVRMTTSPSGEITGYEEVFRTWKMPEEDLDRKGGMLFGLMVNNGDLTPFYPENSGDEEYIEFPNADVWFDAGKRTWVSRLYNPREEFQRQFSSGAGN